MRGRRRGAVSKELGFNIFVSEFEIQSRFLFHQTISSANPYFYQLWV